MVASPYQQPVLAAAVELGLSSAAEIERSADLGLSLVGFDVDQLTDWWQRDNQQLGPSAIDALIASLRRYFADRYSGWYPTLGKNRFLQHVDGWYHVGGWGDDGNRPIAADQVPRLRSGNAGQGVRIGCPTRPSIRTLC